MQEPQNANKMKKIIKIGHMENIILILTGLKNVL